MTAELSLAGIEVVADVVDGRAAVDAVAAHQPDAVVLAEVLPKMSGSEAARLIRLSNPRTRIVFYTALRGRQFPDADRVVEHSHDHSELIRVLLGLA